MSVLHQQANKYKSQDLNDVLWPLYKESGSLSAVQGWAKENGYDITQPTLSKMADYFGWKEKRDQVLKAGFAGSADDDADLDLMLADLVRLKSEIHNILVEAPLDETLNKIYGNYITQILKIREIKIRSKSVDKTELLIDALRGVVQFLTDNGHDDAAGYLGEHLEVVAIKVKEKWEASRKP